MDSAFAWLQYLADFIARLVPKWDIVPTTHGWVMWVGGKRVISGGPGIIWWWPARTEVKIYPVARQALDLRPQTLTTKDGKTLLVGGLLSFSIEDIEKALAYTWSIDETLRDITLTALKHVITRMTWEEIHDAEQVGRLDKRLRHATRLRLRPYGIKVLKVSLTDIAPTRVIKLAMSTDTIT